MTQPLLDDSYDYYLARTRNTSEALRTMVGNASELQRLYDNLGYGIESELKAGRILDQIKSRLEKGEPVTEPLDELEDSLRKIWSHFTCRGCCLGHSLPELGDAEKKAFVEANPSPISEEQWRWHRNESDLYLGVEIDRLRNSSNEDSETRLKHWDEISKAVHNALVWLFEQRTQKELGSTEECWRRQGRLEELNEFLNEVVSHDRNRARHKFGLGKKENSLFRELRLKEDYEITVEFAKEYLERPWAQTPWLTRYLLVDILDAQLAINPASELGGGRSFWISAAVVAGVVLAFLFGFKWIGLAGIAYLVLKWFLGFWVRCKFARAQTSLQLVRDEVAELSGFDADELIRRLRQMEAQWPYLPSITYSLLRLGSGRAVTSESTG